MILIMGNIAIKQHGAPGGGACLYVNELWCKYITLKESYCDKDVEEEEEEETLFVNGMHNNIV